MNLNDKRAPIRISDVFDKKGEQIATNAFYNNKWTAVNDGYQINFDPDLLNQVKNAPITCNLDNHIIYEFYPNRSISTAARAVFS